MAKGNPYWGKQRGKLGETVLAVTKGQQVQRAYNSQPANPRSDAQMVQRISFASMVAFYKRGNQNLFKYAFEDKKQTESDYNAFMRHNLTLGIDIYPTKEEVGNICFPLVAPFMVTNGSLQEIGCSHEGDGVIGSSLIYDDATTWDQFLANNPQFNVGDIITFLGIFTGSKYSDVTGKIEVTTTPPRWVIHQVEVGAPLGSEGLAAYFNINGLAVGDMVTYETSTDGVESLEVCGACWICSRPSASGLKVSTAQLLLNPYAQQVYEFLSDDGNRALPTWKASGDALLEGNAVIDVETTITRTGDYSTRKAGQGNVYPFVTNIFPKIPYVNPNLEVVFTGGTAAGSIVYNKVLGEEQSVTIAGVNCTIRFTENAFYLNAPSTVTWEALTVNCQGDEIDPNAQSLLRTFL